MFFKKTPEIEFILSDPTLKGLVPEPYPSRKLIPDWYKKLPHYKNDDDGMTNPTLKRCPPFLDAMTVGWIIPTPADVTVRIDDEGSHIHWEKRFSHEVMSWHGSHQIQTHPNAATVAVKMLNYWIVKTPPGWSSIFTPPFNRPSDIFDLFTGIVDTDDFFECVNFPGFFKAKTGSFVIKQGEPLMQVIPFKRDFSKNATIRTLNSKEAEKLEFHRKRQCAYASHYREQVWSKK